MTTFSHSRMRACPTHGVYIWVTPADPCPKCATVNALPIVDMSAEALETRSLQNSIIGGLKHFNITGLKRILSFMDYLAAHERNRKLS